MINDPAVRKRFLSTARKLRRIAASIDPDAPLPTGPAVVPMVYASLPWVHFTPRKARS